MQKKERVSFKLLKDKNGLVTTEEEHIMGRQREYFKDLLEQNGIKTNQQNQSRKRTEEITEAIYDKEKKGKTPDRNQITNEVIQTLLDKAIEKRKEIMNLIVSHGEASEDWQIGIITSLYKKGNSQDCHNYRTIILLSTAAKLLAKIIEKRLKTHNSASDLTEAIFMPKKMK